METCSWCGTKCGGLSMLRCLESLRAKFKLTRAELLKANAEIKKLKGQLERHALRVEGKEK